MLLASLDSYDKTISTKGMGLLDALAGMGSAIKVKTNSEESGKEWMRYLNQIIGPILSHTTTFITDSGLVSGPGKVYTKTDLLILTKLLKCCPRIVHPSESSSDYTPFHYLNTNLLRDLITSLSVPKERDLAGIRGKAVLEVLQVEGWLEREYRVANTSQVREVGSEGPSTGQRSLLARKVEEWVDVRAMNMAKARREAFARNGLVDPEATHTWVGASTSISIDTNRDQDSLLDALCKYVQLYSKGILKLGFDY